MLRTHPERAHPLRWLPAAIPATLVFFGLFLLLSCSPGSPVEAELPPRDGTETSASVSGAPATDDPDGSADSATPSPPQPSTPAEPEAAALTLGEDGVVEVIDLAAGEQHTDAQGNLVIVYGISTWPETFDALPVAARAEFSFAPGFDGLSDPRFELVAIDIGMCGAGIGSEADVSGFGTVEFFVHDNGTTPLSNDPAIDRAMVTSPPLAGVGFDFPAEASCARGWLPVLRTQQATNSPATVRYVLTSRSSNSGPIERHVYQWQIDDVGSNLDAGDQREDDTAEDDAGFDIGQTVTFNKGPIAETTVVVEGWAELLGQAATIEGTRPVAVLLSFCPSSLQLVDFGLAVDGWNLIAPAPGDTLLGARTASDPTQSCFDGWLNFAVPYGSVPTGFFATDGVATETGYAFWSLDGAALPPPPDE